MPLVAVIVVFPLKFTWPVPGRKLPPFLAQVLPFIVMVLEPHENVPLLSDTFPFTVKFCVSNVGPLMVRLFNDAISAGDGNSNPVLIGEPEL